MSSTSGAYREQNPDDFYRTPANVTRALLRHLDVNATNILDPAAGDGGILDVVRAEYDGSETRVSGFEIDPGRAEIARVETVDALARPTWRVEGRAPDLIIANPPFSLATEFVNRSLFEVATGGTVAFLLRLSYASSVERATFHEQNASDLWVLDRRPSFAASVKCLGRRRKSNPCAFAVLLPLDLPRPATCPVCGEKTNTTTHDSSDYAWFVWGAAARRRWSVLRVGKEKSTAKTR